MRLRGNELLVDRQIVVDHAIDGELARDRVAAARAPGQRRREARRHVVDVAAHPSVHAVLHNLLDRAAGECDDRRAARHRLDHHQPERLLPLNREQQRPRVSEQRILLSGVGFADVLDLIAVDLRCNLLFPVIPEEWLHFSGELQADAGAPRRFDGQVGPLARRHASEKGDVVGLSR